MLRGMRDRLQCRIILDARIRYIRSVYGWRIMGMRTSGMVPINVYCYSMSISPLFLCVNEKEFLTMHGQVWS